MIQMLLNALLLALRAIRRNLMRSFLTVLGVVIGVAAVITMVTLGNGATRMVSDQISGLGSNLLILRPGQQLGPGRDSAGAPNFKLADVEALQTQIPALKAVAPLVGSKVTLVAGNQNWQSQVSGTSNAARDGSRNQSRRAYSPVCPKGGLPRSCARQATCTVEPMS